MRIVRPNTKRKLIHVPTNIEAVAQKKGYKNSTRMIESLIDKQFEEFKQNPLHDNQSF